MTMRLKNPCLLLAAMFAASRIVYVLIGLKFDAATIGNFWHYIDPALLKEELLHSVWYLHSQPPLYNLALGIGLKLWGTAGAYYHIIHLLMGLAVTLLLFDISVKLGVKKQIAFFISALYLISPSFILYENILFYTFPLAFLLILSMWLLLRFSQSASPFFVHLFFWSLAAIMLIRSMFHLVWFLAIVAANLVIRPADRRRIVAAALLPFLIVLSIYVKNGILFGEFGTSSWFGMNLARISTFQFPEQKREELAKESMPLANIRPFSSLDRYADYIEFDSTGIPVLDQQTQSTGAVNLHNINYIRISRMYKKDAMHTIVHYPSAYLKGVAKAFYAYISPPSEWPPLEANAAKLGAWHSTWNSLVYGRLQNTPSNDNEPRSPLYPLLRASMLVIIGMPILFLFGAKRFWNFLPKRNDLAMVLFYLLFNILYVTVMGNLFDAGENNRFRFLIESHLVILFGLFISNLIHKKA